MYDYTLEHLCTISAGLQNPPEVIGPTPEGLRMNIYITGGEVKGTHLNGKVLPVGADWLTVRSDGVGILDIRATLETDDGAFVDMDYDGIATFTDEQINGLLKGTFPEEVHCLTTSRFETGHSSYLWLNKIKACASGKAFFKGNDISIEYSVYALR